MLAQGGRLDANVVGTTRLIGGKIAALDASGADSRNLRLVTGNLTVADIADSARSRDASLGVSANVNDPFRKGVAGANTPVLDGSLASTNFAQTTRATIGQGSVTVGTPEGSAALATANRDVATTQVVTRDDRSGFTVYADKAAANELGALVTGDKANSTILKGAAELAARPFGILEDAAAEIKAFGHKTGDPATRNDSQLEKLISQLGSVLLPKSVDLARRAAANEADFVASGLGQGYPAADVEVARGKLAASGYFTAKAAADRRDALEREAYRVSPDKLDRTGTELNDATLAAKTRSATTPGSSSRSVADPSATTTVDDIVVTALRRPSSGVPNLVHDGLGALGGAYSRASPLTQRIISGSIGVLSDGVIGTVTGEVVGGIASRVAPGAMKVLADTVTTVFVGADGYLQNRSFSPVKAENDARDNSRRTPDAVVGTGLVVSALPIIATVRKLAKVVPNTPPGGVPVVFDGVPDGFTLTGRLTSDGRPIYTDGRGTFTTANRSAGSGPTIQVDANGRALPGDWSSTSKLTAPQNALKHWGSHGTEFPEYSNAAQYVAGAQKFVTNPPAGTLSRIGANGDAYFYNPATNTFAVRASTGGPRTMFKPDPSKHGYPTNLDYFNAQK